MDKALEVYAAIQEEKDAVVHISDAADNHGELTESFSTGFFEFDEAMLGGVRFGDLVIVTGISGHGKTTALLNISVNLSKSVLPSLWFSYEVLMNNLYAKFMQMGGDTSKMAIYTPKIISSGNLSWVKKKIEEGVEKHGARFVFIDHIDFLAPSNSKVSVEQKRIVLREICQELKSMAIEMRLVIFLAAHVKKVQGRDIEMQDISEASGIYQLADYVILIERLSKSIKVVGDDGSTKKMNVLTGGSMLRMLKNRLTGQLPYFNFTMENNIIWSENKPRPLSEMDITIQ